MKCVVADHPAEFLERVQQFIMRQPQANHHLLTALQPWINGVISSQMELRAAHVCDESGDVVGVAATVRRLRAAVAFVSPAVPPVVEQLEAALSDHDTDIRMVGGPAEAAATFAAQWSRRIGQPVRPSTRLAVYSYTQPPPDVVPGVPGVARPMRDDDVPLVAEWWEEYVSEAGQHPGGMDATAAIAERRHLGELYLWEVDERPVALIGCTNPTWGYVVGTTGYSPSQYRRQGYVIALTNAVIQELYNRERLMFMTVAAVTNRASSSLLGKAGFERAETELQHYALP